MIRTLLLSCLISLSSWSSLHAQQEVIAESISNAYSCDTLIAGQIHTMRIRVRNLNTPPGSGFNYINAFRIYSPDGANYGLPFADTLRNPATPGVAFLGKAQSPDCGITYLSRDGLLADTIIFFGQNPLGANPGIASGMDEVVWTIGFSSHFPLDTGKHICVEAITVPPVENWKWEGNGAPDTVPVWKESHCFQLLGVTNRIPNDVQVICSPPPPPCCVGMTGNVDCDPQNNVDIVDLTALVDRLFISFGELCCLDEANVDTEAGIDLVDLTLLVDYLFISFTPLPACSGL